MSRTRIQTTRFDTAGDRPAGLPSGTLYINFRDLALGVVDVSGDAQDLVAIPYHSDEASYPINQLVAYDGSVYRSTQAITPEAFDPSHWVQVDASPVTVDSTPPASPVVGAIWLDTTNPDFFQLYVYDGSSWTDHAHDRLYIPAFSVSDEYMAGSFVSHEGRFWISVTDIPTPAPWDESEWALITYRVSTGATEPLGALEGDTWFDTSVAGQPRLWVRSGGAWTDHTHGRVIAAPFEAAEDYPEGAFVIEAGQLYVAKADVPAAPFDAADWYQISGSGGGGGGASVTVSDTPPVSPSAGDLWYSSSDPLGLFIWYVDVDGAQWVQVGNGSISPSDVFVNRAGDDMSGALGVLGTLTVRQDDPGDDLAVNFLDDNEDLLGGLSWDDAAERVTVGFPGAGGSLQDKIEVGQGGVYMTLANNPDVIRAFDDGMILYSLISTPGIGNTNTGLSLRGTGALNVSSGVVGSSFNRNNAGTLIAARYSGNQVGSISVTNTDTAFNTTSDYRLKELLVDDRDETHLERLRRIRIRYFAWTGTEKKQDGVLAHELQDTHPHAVTGEKDAKGPDGEIIPQQVDYSKLVPEIIASMHDLEDMVRAQAAEIIALRKQLEDLQ